MFACLHFEGSTKAIIISHSTETDDSDNFYLDILKPISVEKNRYIPISKPIHNDAIDNEVFKDEETVLEQWDDSCDDAL